MVDETMSLRLPKPLLGNEIRSDFLNFSPDRRWDLLGFIKSDEVEEIKSCDVGPDGHRYYLVHWKDSWKPESSLVYCEKLLQDFWSRRSLLHDNEIITQTMAPSDITHSLAQTDIIAGSLVPSEITNSLATCDITQSLATSYVTHILATPDISQNLTISDKVNIIECREHAIESTINDEVNHDGVNEGMETIPACDGIIDDVDCTRMGQGSEDGSLKDKLMESSENIFTSECVAEKDGSLVVVIDSSELRHVEACDQTCDRTRDQTCDQTCDPTSCQSCDSSCDQTCDQSNISNEPLEGIPAQLEIKKIDNLVENHNTVAEHINRDMVMKSIPNPEDQDVKCIHQMQVAISDISPGTGNANNDMDSPSKKGAPKRKARPPRQSVHSLGTKACLAKKKEKIKKAKEKIKKIKEKGKGPKILKTVSTIINSRATQQNLNGGITNEESECALGNLKCMVCDKLLSTQQSLMKHLLTHNNNHTCPICQKTFKSTHFLRHHMDIHNASYQYSCPMCDKKFKFKNNMHGHIRKHNMEKKFECEVCHKKFIGRYNLKEHLKSHSDSRPYACDFCTKAYKDRGALNKHLLTHQEKRVECEICKRPFTNIKQVKRHMQFHYSWPGDSFKRKTNIGPDGEKIKFKCPHCDKMFNHYSNMNAHVHKKHKEKKIQCSNCSKTFAYQYELREHMFIHLGGQGSKFKCQFCHKSFQRSTTLKNHERTTHLGIKRFKCEICGKMFGTKFNMKVHVEKLHSNIVADPDEEKPLHTQSCESDVITSSFATPDVHTGLTPISGSLSSDHQHPLLCAISTSDIIRNAMSHIPELSYFPPLPGHPPRYQFYGMTQTDFTVPESIIG